MIRFHLLGPPDLRDAEGRPRAITGAKRLALLAYLALESRRGPVRRDTLVGLLWPESSQKRARNALSNVVFHVRKALGPDVFTATGTEELGLAAESVWCDALAFEAAVGEGRLGEALDLYRGDLLEGFFAPSAGAEFDHWVDGERARLRRLATDAARRRIEEAEGLGDRVEALRIARWLCGLAPEDEAAARRLMSLLDSSGDRAGALRAYERLASRLERELGVEPTAETRALAKRVRLRDEGATGARAAAPGHGDAAGEPARREPAAPELPVRTVAVLPFANLGATADAEPFVAGLHDDLLTELSRISALRVIARTSVLRYRGTDLPVAEIARELGAGTIVEGGVQAAGDRIRVNVQVVDGRDSAHRWAERFDRELSAETIFEIQQELAERITGAVRADLTDAERKRGAVPATEDLQAYRLYVKGRGYLDQRTEIGILKSIAFFERAVELDERYALAWSGLADAVVLLHDYGFDDAAHDLTVAERAVGRALELGPELAEAHASLGMVHSIRRRGTEALAALARSVEIRPGYADAHNWLSWHRSVFGMPGPALESARRAVELDPVAPEPASNLALSLLINGHLEESLAAARRTTELQPDWTTGRFTEGLALYELGRFEESAEVLRGLRVEWVDDGPRAAFAVACAAMGNVVEARALLDAFERLDDSFSAGLVRLALGERDAAFDHFRRITRWTYWPTLAIHHFFRATLAPLRADPLGDTLKARMAEAWGLGRPRAAYRPRAGHG